MRSSDILRDYSRQNLDMDCLSRWSEFLLNEGFESDDLYFLLSKPDLHWSELPTYVEKLCKEFRICDDFTNPREAYKSVSLSEFKSGILSGPELLFNFDEIRTDVGFPETLTWKIMEDEADRINKSGIYSDVSKKTGKELAAYVSKYIEKANL